MRLCQFYLVGLGLSLGCADGAKPPDRSIETETTGAESESDLNPDGGDDTEPTKPDITFEPTFTLKRYEPDETADGLTLFAVQGGEQTFTHPDWLDFGYLAAIPMAANGDTADRILPEWIYTDFEGGAFSYVDLLPDGRIRAIRGDDGGVRLVELDPTLPKTVAVYDDVMVNHYAVSLPDGNTLVIWSEYLEHEQYGADLDGDGKKEIRVEHVRVIDPSGNERWDWSVYEHDPDAPIAQAYVVFTEWWSNCNAVSFAPKPKWTSATPLEGDIYLNCRLLNRLYKINYPTGDIEWIMGEGGDFGNGFFYHSHDPQIFFDVDKTGKRTHTHILLYDNRESPPLGNAAICPPDETCPDGLTRYSRVIEVVADEDLNAEIVWKWPRPSAPDFEDYHFYSPIGGGVVRLENGNLLITNATEGGNPFLGEVCRGRLLELKRDGSLGGAEVVWEVVFNKNYGTYHAVRIPMAAASDWTSRLIP